MTRGSRRGAAWSVLFVLACAEKETPVEPTTTTDARRIVTLAPSLTAVVLALGAGDRLVGVTRFDDAPEVKSVRRVGGFNDPSVETLLALQPDLVLAQPSPGNRGAVETLRRRGIPVLVLALEKTLADVETTIRTIAKPLGLQGKAEELAGRIEAARVKAGARSVKRIRKPHVAILFGLNPMVAGGPGSFVHDLLTLAGATNAIAASTQDYPHVAPTTLLAADPPLDALLLAGMDVHGAGSDALPEGLAGRAKALKSSGFLQPGPLAVEALDELGDVLDTLATGATR